MGLKATKEMSEFVNENNELCCFSPSITNKDKAFLLINKRMFLDYLKSNNLEIIWTILGEKNIIGGPRSTEYSDRLKISGAYKMCQNGLKGKVNTKVS
jgi:hypothetical protein